MIYIVIALLVIGLAISLFYNYKFAMTVLRVEDAIEEALDSLDKRYSTMSAILSKPVFFDSPEVRQVIKEIAITRDSILRIANVLVSNIQAEIKEIEEENQHHNIYPKSQPLALYMLLNKLAVF
jgi:hypothetical protein